MTVRAIGPFNGALPEPTGMVIGFMRDPKRAPYLRYVQMVPAPEVVFYYWRLDSDDAVRLPSLNEFAWAYDDYRPTGKGFQVRADAVDDRTQRWDFPYTLGEQTIRIWQRHGMNVRQLFDRVRANHASLHRAVRCIKALQGAAWGSFNTATPQQLIGAAAAVYFDDSSGTELLPSGLPNPNFQIIKRTLAVIKRRIGLQTNSAVEGEELVWVLPPADAQVVANSGEIVNFIKQSSLAGPLMSPNIVNWGLPEEYGGFKIVVEDTPRVFIRQKDDGTVADVTVASEKDYILPAGTSYFVSRPGGLDGQFGFRNFSTLQCYYYNGEARIEAFSEPKHELVEGHVVMEDKVVVPAVISGFQLTGYRR